jgi:hypothetical protein
MPKMVSECDLEPILASFIDFFDYFANRSKMATECDLKLFLASFG